MYIFWVYSDYIHYPQQTLYLFSTDVIIFRTAPISELTATIKWSFKYVPPNSRITSKASEEKPFGG